MGSRSIQLAQHPFDLPELFHQVAFGMQAPGGIGDQDIHRAGPR